MFDFGINKKEVRWIISVILIITGYTMMNPYITGFLTDSLPLNGFWIGLIILIGGLWVFRIQ